MAQSSYGFDAKIALQICDRMAQGRSLKSICADKDMPVRQTIYNWLSTHPDFVTQYNRAAQDRAAARFEKIDEVIADMRKGNVDFRMARVEIDAIKWQISKEYPKRYGDRVQTDHGISDDLATMLGDISANAASSPMGRLKSGK